jgi:HAD superfamily hydrolase (TIGR01509 family)
MKNLGILWDYNGVIVNDEHLHEKAMTEILSRHGFILTPELYRKHCLGRSDKASYENLQKVFPNIDNISAEDFIIAKTAVYLPLTKTESIVWPGLKDLFKTLDEQFLMAIITGSGPDEILPTLEKEGITHWFQTVITAHDVNRSKPDPEGYLKGVRALNIPAENIVVIEDTPAGFRAAKAAGLKCIAVLHTSPTENLEEADKIVESVVEITPDLIKGLLNK